jgi:hypothetical protein
MYLLRYSNRLRVICQAHMNPRYLGEGGEAGSDGEEGGRGGMRWLGRVI